MLSRVIIFDLDGTLVEAKEWHYEALNRALGLFGYTIGREDHETIYNGLPTRVKLRILSDTQGLPESLYSVVEELKQVFTFKIIEEKCKPVENVLNTIKTLKEKGYVVGLASNSIRHSVDLMLHKSEIYDYFDLILSNQDVERPKPSPDIYLKAAKLFKVSPKDCVVVEDNDKGIQAGLDAGMKVIKVSSPQDISYKLITEKT